MYVSSTKKGVPFPKGEIKPYGPLPIYPTSTILSYGQGVFEGIKAFRTSKKRIVIFRPDENHKRLTNSCEAFLMPVVPKDAFFHAMDELVKICSPFVPPENEGSLYLRPCVFGSGESLGVMPSPSYLFTIYATPVGNYFPGGKLTPISLIVSQKTHRAAPHGSGHVKACGNYAPCFREQQAAKEAGYNDTLFLDSVHDKYVEEAGAANAFCVDHNGTLITPELGCILPGVTRKSVIEIAKSWGVKVEEKKVDVNEFVNAKEAFATGTGASITPIGKISWKGKVYNLGDGGVGNLTKKISEALLGIQFERVEDKWGWLYDPFHSK